MPQTPTNRNMPGVTMGRRDPESGRIDWRSPNDGQYPMRHVDTFQSSYSSFANVYRDYDEALIDSRYNAKAMRNDVGVRECLDSRQRSVAMLNWHVAPENDASADQREFCDLLEKVCRRIRRFTEYRRNCQHAIWYGKYAIQHRWAPQVVDNRSIYMPTPRHQDDYGWKPMHGDKLVFRMLKPNQQHVAGSYEGQLGIRVGASHRVGDLVGNRWRVEPTEYGLAYFLAPAERRLLAVHKHHIEDASWDDALRAGTIHGVGIRSVIYWEWVQKQETMAFLMEFMERMAGGIQVWKYPAGNKQAEEEARSAAENYNSGQQHVLLVPVPPGDVGQYGVEVIDPGFSGVETLHNLLTSYFNHRIKRYILGQVLSSEAESTGLGSGVAELHQDTLLQIIKSDATNLEETLTTDLLETIIRINVQRGVWTNPGFVPKFTIETEEQDVDKKLEAWTSLIDRGMKFRLSDLYELVGAAEPGPQDAVLTPPSQQQQGPPGMPGAGGPPAEGDADGQVNEAVEAEAMKHAAGEPREPAEHPKPNNGHTQRYQRAILNGKSRT